MLRGVLVAAARDLGRSDVLDELRPPADPMPAPAAHLAGLFADALRQVEGGSIPAAARSIEKALKKAPNDVACLALGVMIQTRRGDRALAEAHGRRAVALAPRVAGLHLNLGNCLRDQRKYEEALACYGEALALAPDVIQTGFNIAQCLGQLGRRDEAAAAWRGVLALPAETPPALICRACALVALGELAEAEPLLARILSEAPSNGVAKMELASLYRRTRRHDLAEPLLHDVVRAEPGNWAAYLQLAGLYHEMNRFADAEGTARQARALNPEDPNVLIVLANALCESGALPEAEAYAREALTGETGEGLPSHRHVLGVILQRQGRYGEAGRIFEAVAAAEPDTGWARFTLALHLLRQGDFERGWFEHEWRWRWDQNPEPPRSYPQPQWSRSARKNSTVLVWAEQGLGDSIQFLRFIPMLAGLGYRPLVEVQKPLKVLVAETLPFPVLTQGDPPPSFDYQIPFLSLCRALGVTLDEIPGKAGYLRADPDRAARWRDRLQPDAKPLVGLVWAGNPRHADDRRRSLPLDRLGPLLDVDCIRFVSLQKQVNEGDRAALDRFADRLECRWIEHSEDFADSAALIANLDLVVSVDGGVAHLAGAMGKPVWLLLPFCPDWRWLTEREDSVWYDSLRLFRQPAPSDWEAPVNRVAGELGRWASGPC